MRDDRPRILVIGYNACDVAVSLAALPAPDSKLEVEHMVLGGGGPGATAAVALSRLGNRVRLLTPLAGDPAGVLQETELAAAGVDTTLCPRLPGAASPLAVILVDPADGSRRILWSRGALPPLPVPDCPEALVDEADLLYVDGHEPDASVACAEAARARGLPVVMDAGSVREGSVALVARCTDVISSAVFAPDFTKREDPEGALRALREAGPERVAMTCGAHGALALTEDGCRVVPAFDVPVVDTTGAGDAFHAGYADARVRGCGMLASLRYGAAVAALKCGGWGGRSTLPDRNQVEELLAQGTLRPPAGPFARFPRAGDDRD